MSKTTKHTKTPLSLTETLQMIFDKVIADTIDPLAKSDQENEYSFTLLCDLSKYLVAVPVQNKNAKTVAKAISEEFILKNGPINPFITDMGTEYKNSIIEHLCENLNISTPS